VGTQGAAVPKGRDGRVTLSHVRGRCFSVLFSRSSVPPFPHSARSSASLCSGVEFASGNPSNEARQGSESGRTRMFGQARHADQARTLHSWNRGQVAALMTRFTGVGVLVETPPYSGSAGPTSVKSEGGGDSDVIRSRVTMAGHVSLAGLDPMCNSPSAAPLYRGWATGGSGWTYKAPDPTDGIATFVTDGRANIIDQQVATGSWENQSWDSAPAIGIVLGPYQWGTDVTRHTGAKPFPGRLKRRGPTSGLPWIRSPSRCYCRVWIAYFAPGSSRFGFHPQACSGVHNVGRGGRELRIVYGVDRGDYSQRLRANLRGWAAKRPDSQRAPVR